MPPINAACCGCVNYDKSTAEVFLRCTGCGTMWKDTALRQQLAEARASEQRMIEVAANRVAKAEFWKATTETANQTIAAQAAELERLRKAANGLLSMMDEIPDYPDGCQKDRVFAEFEFDELRKALGG